jgi:hypothetical protein
VTQVVDVPIIMAAAALARRSPQEWGAFIEQLTLTVDKLKTSLINATPSELPTAQGRAQVGAQLLELLATSVTRADVINKNYPPRRPDKVSPSPQNWSA